MAVQARYSLMVADLADPADTGAWVIVGPAGPNLVEVDIGSPPLGARIILYCTRAAADNLALQILTAVSNMDNGGMATPGGAG